METKMGVREALNRRKSSAALLAVGLIVVAIAILIYEFRPVPVRPFPTKMFYTVDDGKTWFADDVSKPSPFEKDGKQAYRCFVYRCRGASVPWVQYMERQQRREAPPAKPGEPPLPLPPVGEWEVKRPGDAEWVVVSDRAADALKSPRCPNGNDGVPEQVLP